METSKESNNNEINQTEGEASSLEKGIIDINEKLTKLLDLPQSKKKDNWDKLQALSSLFSGVFLAAIGLLFTIMYNWKTAEHQLKTQELQDKMQRDQFAYEIQKTAHQDNIRNQEFRLAQLKALVEWAPFVASKDTGISRYAKDVLKAFLNDTVLSDSTSSNKPSYEVGNGNTKAADKTNEKAKSTEILSTTDITGSTTVPEIGRESADLAFLRKGLKIVLAPTTPVDKGKEVTTKIGDIYHDKNTKPKVKAEAKAALEKIAFSNKLPDATKNIALEALKEIRSIEPADIYGYISSQKLTRPINEIILHHTYSPSIKSYQGVQSLEAIGKFELDAQNWNALSWHFAVSPDGKIWLGMPLNEQAIHTSGHNANSISIYLIMNGDVELPTEQQQNALRLLLKALEGKTGIEINKMFANGKGFHRNYYSKSCPGALVTKEFMITLLNKK